MSDSRSTVRPVSGAQNNDAGFSPLPGGTTHGNLADDDPTTYIRNTASLVGTSGTYAVQLASFALSDTDLFKYLQVWLTMSVANPGDDVSVVVKVYSPDGSKRLPDQVVDVVYPAEGKYLLLPFAGWPDGSAFTADDLAGLVLRFYVTSNLTPLFVAGTTNIQELHIIEAGVDMVYNRAPTVTITPNLLDPWPASLVQQFTFADPESDPMERFQQRIYARPGAGFPAGTDDDVIAAFDAAGTQALYEGEVLTDLAQTSKVVMPPTGVYRSYIRAADEGSGQRYGSWAHSQFVMFTPAAARPRLPVPVVSALPLQAIVKFSVTSVTTDINGHVPGVLGATPNWFEVERSSDGGLTWHPVVDSPFTWTVEPTVFYDRYAPRETLLIYRIRSVVTGNGNNTPFTPDIHASEWVTVTSPGVLILNSDGNAWLQSPDDTTLDLSFCQAGTIFDLSSSENEAVFYAEGRSDPVIFGGTVHLRQISAISLALKTDAAWTKFQALRALRGKMLLRTLYGEGPLVDVWVRLGATVTESLIGGYATQQGQVRRVTVAASEVSPP